ncbi:MAG TPA: GNAT family protein [Pedococcus sp.]|jgi:RimJ/RimL family protein N-acetyltransferase
MPAPTATFADKPTLTGERVVLRPFVESDLPALAAAIADPEVGRLTGSVHSTAELGRPHDQARLREWYLTRAGQDDRLDLAIVDRVAGQCVGEAVLNEWEPENGACNFRILIGPGGRDRGLGTEATRLILGHAFEALGLHRVSLEVYAFNPRGRRAYEKAGFVLEGVRRDALCFDGEYVDSELMSVLAPEWEQHRGRP